MKQPNIVDKSNLYESPTNSEWSAGQITAFYTIAKKITTGNSTWWDKLLHILLQPINLFSSTVVLSFL